MPPNSLELGIAAMTGMVRDLKANPERMRAVASADYSVATDLADWLVRKVGLPFRQAHHVTGRLVGIAADKGVDLDKLSLAEMQAVEPGIDRGVYRVLTVEASVAARKSLGGTAPANVARAVDRGAARRFLGRRKGRGDELLCLQERRHARRGRGARHHRGPGRHAVLLLLGRRPARGVAGIRRRHQGHERRGLLRHEGQLATSRSSACSASWAPGADIVSVGEMRRALAAGIPAKRIIYSGVGKKASELMAALEAGVGQINVESSAELETLNAVAGQLGVKADITIRVNPDVDAGTHAKITTGRKENKFGIDIDLAREAFALAGRLPNLKVVGVAMHIGSQLTSLDPYRDAIVPGARADRPAARRWPPRSTASISAAAWGSFMPTRSRPRSPTSWPWSPRKPRAWAVS